MVPIRGTLSPLKRQSCCDTFIMRVKTHQAEDITHFFPVRIVTCIRFFPFFFKQRNVQWRGLGFNWDNECLLWKRSRWVKRWKETLITAATYPVIEWMVTPRWGAKLLCPAVPIDDTSCCCTWKRKKKRIVCVIWRPLPLLLSTALCFSCGWKPLGCNAPLLVWQSVKTSSHLISVCWD